MTAMAEHEIPRTRGRRRPGHDRLHAPVVATRAIALLHGIEGRSVIARDPGVARRTVGKQPRMPRMRKRGARGDRFGRRLRADQNRESLEHRHADHADHDESELVHGARSVIAGAGAPAPSSPTRSGRRMSASAPAAKRYVRPSDARHCP